KPATVNDRSPVLAVRSGDWKLLMNADGTDQQLYNLGQSIREDDNLCHQYPRITQKLAHQLNSWKNELPNYPK
ncbi:MAG: N-acetylgalactosamine-6-sulfatase, partial [Planctomycetota bacterium]|nr:N-acetylgalactosamine-6-sulfatase [Planctomycetota bacterium]